MTFSVLIRLLIGLGFFLLLDVYAYQPFKVLYRDAPLAKWLYWGVSVIMVGLLIAVMFTVSRSSGMTTLFSLFMAAFVLIYVPKFILIAIMLVEDFTRIIGGIAGQGAEGTFLPDRKRFISQMALALAAIPFVGVLHGVFRGRYNFKVIKKDLVFDDLPEAFDGFTITQISDIHSGSFDNSNKVRYGIDLINEQKSDLILFTGDLVNNKAEEMEPWIEEFSRLKASHGKYSVLGNHDYGDYVDWPNVESKRDNLKRLFEIHKELGFQLLNNDSVAIKKGDAKINIVGVENWGHGFAQHGDLDKASASLKLGDFNVLMSHDPSHFDEVVKNFKKKMHLTLSGHTHGMQFGIEIPGIIKWSPVKYRYKKWAGLYEEMGKKLYVNRGFGYLAFPGRVGIWPEITVLTLKRGI